jgi:hypothetical protein
MRNMRLLVLALSAALMTNQAIAENMDGHSSMPDKAELEAALEECFSSLEAGNDGRPDPEAMDSCMSEKGFSKPSGRGPGGGHGNPPPDR